MCKCEVNILEYRFSIRKVITYLLEYFTLLMRTGKYLDSYSRKQCLKDIEDTGVEKEQLGNMEKTLDCPLCLEPLEFDDKNFFPCTCGYQVCRFCWHRIRTNENGLCPACRRIYSENPANFQPLTPEELQKVKQQKKLKDIQKKQKLAENRKLLGNIRVIQKNLVFAVGLPLELSQDNEKKEKVLHMFRQYGTTQKETITDRTSYAGSQGPSACVYITYQKAEDAVRAVKALTNTKIEGRNIKVSLGTTKYCSNFLKNAQCPKAECLYLHELADEEASFSKEDIHSGKHLEYEQKLLEQTLNNNTLHSKVLLPSTDSNRTNQSNHHNRNGDNCSESSEELQQNSSIYDSSEASELSPTSNSQNLESIRNLGSELHNETEINYQNSNLTNSVLKTAMNHSPNQTLFRSEEAIIVNNHTLNSNFQTTALNPNYSNHHVLKDNGYLPQPNFLNNQIYEELQARAQSSNSKESSSFLRSLISSSQSIDSDLKKSSPDVKHDNGENDEKIEAYAELVFDPCKIALQELAELVDSEDKKQARIHYNALNESPVSNNRSPTLSSVEPFEIKSIRNNIASQSVKIRDPPPGFTNNNTPNIHYKSPYETVSLNKTPLALHNQMGIRSNFNFPRYTQPNVPSNNSFLPDFTSTLSRDIPEIIPQALQQHQQQQQQSHQRLLNMTQAQFPIEQRSYPWNPQTSGRMESLNQSLFMNQSASENRVANDFNVRMPVRSNDIPIRQWPQQQQQQLTGNINNSLYQEVSQIEQANQAKLQHLFKSFESARNSPNTFGHRLQYTKKL